MAMNKTEQAAFEALKTELAFRWPTEAEPERTVRVLSGGDRLDGWNFNTHNGQVGKYWTGSVSHGTYYQGERMPGAQGGRALYATRREAMIGMRWAMCREMAAKLRALDLMLESDAE